MSKMKMEYLATPYSHKSQEVKDYRASVSDLIAMKLTMRGRLIYAPMSSWHHIARKYDMPTDAKFWEKLNLSFLANCDKLLVIMLPGWADSIGVGDEIDFALEHNIEIVYLNPKLYLKDLKKED